MSVSPRQLEVLLRAAGEAAAVQAPLPAALRAHGGPLGPAVATALEGGADLRAALAGLLPPRQLDLLAGERPPLAQAALLVAEDLRLAREARWRWFEILVQPVVSLLAVLAYALVAGAWSGSGLALAWVAVAGVGTVLLAGAVAVASRPALAGVLPWLGALALHARQAGRYERAALCARWRLPEAQLAPLLGADLAGLGPVLARADGEAHCRRLADWHRASALRAQARVARVLALLLAVIAGCLILAAAAPAVGALVAEQIGAAEGI